MSKFNSILAAIAVSAFVYSCGDTTDALQFDLGGELTESNSCGITLSNCCPPPASKPEGNANPLISDIFCADPTAVEYDGRLYVYGTNDHQQYEAVGSDGKNTYEKIKSLAMLSTDDMANWTYHGNINVGEISPWALASWAPSVTSRTEKDGKTHFYLYYSNSGCGVGVLTAEAPTGPWSDPLGEPLISVSTPGLKDCPNPFDPGVCTDENGKSWITFGGGKAPDGSTYMPGSVRIAQLGDDMTSLSGSISEIPAPYFFEASELNYINGTYVYTYNTNWDTRIEWENKEYPRPAACSMAYMKTKTPLDPESWEYCGDYFKNPGEQGLEYSNNHTHLQKYGDKYYLFYHSLFPQRSLGTEGGFRSICVNEISVNENTVTYSAASGNKEGTPQIRQLDPYSVNQAETLFTSSGITYTASEECGNMLVSGKNGSWTYVKGADFSEGMSAFAAKVKGKGRIEVYADSTDSKCIAAIEFDTDRFADIYTADTESVSGTHDLYFVISGEDMQFDKWQFLKK